MKFFIIIMIFLSCASTKQSNSSGLNLNEHMFRKKIEDFSVIKKTRAPNSLIQALRNCRYHCSYTFLSSWGLMGERYNFPPMFVPDICISKCASELSDDMLSNNLHKYINLYDHPVPWDRFKEFFNK